MQLSPTDRVRWTWLLVLVTLVIAAALWWKPSHEERVVLAPAASRPVPIVVHEPAPQPIAPPAPLPVAAAAPPLRLVGTVAAGAGSFAMVRNTTDSQLLQLRVGDHVDGFAVTAIEPDRVVLAGAAQPVVLQTEKAAPVAVAPEPAAAASAAAKAPGPYAEGQAPWDLVPPFQH